MVGGRLCLRNILTFQHEETSLWVLALMNHRFHLSAGFGQMPSLEKVDRDV